MNQWYVVQTQPRKEQLASQHLNAQDFATFCPLRSRHRGKAGRMVRVMEPLFPCYLFVSLDPKTMAWRAINGTMGVVRLVALGGGRTAMPTAAPAGLVDQLRSHCDVRGEFHFDEKFAPGDRVRVMGGPFDTLCGTLETAQPSNRVVILLDFMTRQTRIAMPSSRLSAA